MNPWARHAAALAGTGTAVLGYSLVEARLPVLRRLDVPVLAPGSEPLSILHLSDLHLTGRSEARVAWVRGLADLHPDMVINTGDNLSFASGLEPLGRALEPFLHLPGAFVLGDHDYRTTVFRPPTRYLRADPRTADSPQQRARIAELPWRELRSMLAGGGWVDLTNARGGLEVAGQHIDLVGVDDPHVEQDRYPAPRAGAYEPAAPGGPEAPVRPGENPGHGAAAPYGSADRAVTAVRSVSGRPLLIGLTHAPYRRVLDAMVSDGVDLALAGHTHGGQLCLPGVGALVTNCDLDRHQAKGLSRYLSQQPGGTDHEASGMYLHVSAGLGTSPYTPVRLACRPEATLLRLVPAPHATAGHRPPH